MTTLDKKVLEAFLLTIPSMPIEKRVKLFVKTREAKSVAKKAFDEQEAQFTRIMDTCQNSMLKDAQVQGVTGFNTPFGTTYKAETAKYSIADDVAYEAFLKTQEHPFLFFERRVAATHVGEWIEANGGVLPPGLNVFRENVMRVRKAGEK